MIRLLAFIRAAVAALLLSTPMAVRGQSADPIADKGAIANVMHDYFDAYSRGDMAAVMKFMNVPLVVSGPKGFTAFVTADEYWIGSLNSVMPQ
jgi:hypothetical protein